MADGRFDDMLLGLAQKHKGIEDLMYTILSFFERRTDIFHTKESPDDKTGYAAGKAEEALKKQFRMLQQRYLERAQPHLIYRPPPRGASSSAAPALADVSSAGASSESRSPDAAAGGDGAAGPARVAPAAAPKAQAVPNGVNASPLDGGDPGLWESIEKKKEKYKWSQSVQEVLVEIDVEKCKASDLKIAFKPRGVTVKRKGDVLLEGKLHDKINCEESTWHLDEGKQIVLSMEKIKQCWWERLLEDEPS